MCLVLSWAFWKGKEGNVSPGSCFAEGTAAVWDAGHLSASVVAGPAFNPPPNHLFCLTVRPLLQISVEKRQPRGRERR